MKRTRRSIVLLWCLYISACGALIPKPFHPMNAEEEAVMRTIQTFLEAARSGNQEAIRSVSLPEATFDVINSGHSTGRQSLSHGVPAEVVRPLQQVQAPLLVDFQRLSATHVSIASYLEVAAPDALEKTHLQWDLTQRGTEWRIINFSAALSTALYNIRGGGP